MTLIDQAIVKYWDLVAPIGVDAVRRDAELILDAGTPCNEARGWYGTKPGCSRTKPGGDDANAAEPKPKKAAKAKKETKVKAEIKQAIKKNPRAKDLSESQVEAAAEIVAAKKTTAKKKSTKRATPPAKQKPAPEAPKPKFNLAEDQAAIDNAEGLRMMEKRRFKGYLSELNPNKDSDRAFRDALVYVAGVKKNSDDDISGAFAGMDRLNQMFAVDRKKRQFTDREVSDLSTTFQQTRKGKGGGALPIAGMKMAEEIYDRLPDNQKNIFATSFNPTAFDGMSQVKGASESKMMADIKKRGGFK